MNALWKNMTPVLAATVGWMALSGPALAQTELIIGSFGGAYDEAVLKSAKTFEEQNNAKITMVPAAGGTALAKVRAKEIDILISDPLFTLPLEAEGAYVKLDPQLVPNVAHVHPVAKYSDYTVAANLGAYVLAYSPDRVKEAPTSWYDLARPEFKGRVVMRSFRAESVDLITLFAKAAGGDERNPDAGFEQMAKISENVLAWVQQHAETLQLFKNGDVDIGVWTDGRVAWARNDEGVNVQAVIPKEGFFAFGSTVNVVAGRPNTELAQKFVNHLLGEESGLEMANRLGYFPTNTTIKLPADLEAKLTINSKSVDNLLGTDWKYIVTVFNEWSQRWEREIVR